MHPTLTIEPQLLFLSFHLLQKHILDPLIFFHNKVGCEALLHCPAAKHGPLQFPPA